MTASRHSAKKSQQRKASAPDVEMDEEEFFIERIMDHRRGNVRCAHSFLHDVDIALFKPFFCS